MKKLLILCSLTVISHYAYCQRMHPKMEEIKKAMLKLEFLCGTWTGPGWTQQGPNARNSFIADEKASFKLDSTLILLEGQGYTEDRKQIHHDAIGLVTFDPEKNTYEVRTALASGYITNATGYFEGEKFIWGFSVPTGNMKYEILLDNEGRWIESGFFSPDGDNWYPTMQMKLTKQ